MMKILKLLVILVLMIGAIVLALNWGTLFKGEKPSPFVDQDKIDITKKCDEIRSSWAGQAGWNDSLYQAQREDIDQSRNMNLFSQAGYNTVNNALRESAANKACEGYQAALHASPFSDAELQRNYKGVSTLAKAEQMSDDPRISHVQSLHDLYGKIKAFIASNHAITAQFDKRREAWESFSSKQSKLLSQAKTLRGNPLFSELMHLPGFQDRLNVSKLKSDTDSQRPSFYTSLSNQIVTHFSQKDRTQSNMNLLHQIYNNFTNEEMNYGARELAKCVAQWEIEFGE